MVGTAALAVSVSRMTAAHANRAELYRRIYETLQVHTKSEAVSNALRGRLIP